MRRGRGAPAALLALGGALAAAMGASAQELVSFPSPDGGIVFADDYGEGSHAVVLAHGGRFTKDSWRDQALLLADAGFRVLAIDFRGRGRSRAGGEAAAGDDAAHLDVLAAVGYLRGSGAERVSIVGASFGGWAAARAAIELPAGAVERLVLLAHSPIEGPERLPGRKLFILTREDFSGSGTLRLPAIRDQYERAPGPKELVILRGSAHAQHIFGTERGPRLLEEIVRFLTAP